MNRIKLLILSISLISILLITVGLLFLYSEQLAEQKLNDYIRRLEDESFTTEEYSLSDFHVDGTVRIHFFGDFCSFARQEDVDSIYYDRKIHTLYFLRPTPEGRVEANIFRYK